MLDHSLQQFRLGVIALMLTVVFGTPGYMLVEHWDVLDAVYMTIISVSTTGFREVHPLSQTGRVLTLLLIIAGVGSFAYTGGRGVQFLLERQLFTWRKGMSKQIQRLKDHYIVCGYGKMGKYICEELTERKAPFVLVENDANKLAAIRALGYLHVVGDATSDDTLTAAGLHTARGFVASLGSDADNVFATLSAKSLNPRTFVVARTVEEETESKLLKAGANRVVKPYETAGTKMAELLLRPGVIEFIDIVSRDSKVDLNIEEVVLHEQSPLAGKTLAESNIRSDLNIIVITINKPDGSFVYNPQSSAVLHAGDRLIALGERAHLIHLSRLCSGE
jgi:voltage-gated potassium channel